MQGNEALSPTTHIYMPNRHGRRVELLDEDKEGEESKPRMRKRERKRGIKITWPYLAAKQRTSNAVFADLPLCSLASLYIWYSHPQWPKLFARTFSVDFAEYNAHRLPPALRPRAQSRYGKAGAGTSAVRTTASMRGDGACHTRWIPVNIGDAPFQISSRFTNGEGEWFAFKPPGRHKIWV